MRTPHFQRLAQIDDRHFIMGCRNGIVHLTWGRTTTRFTNDEFRQLAGMLERAADVSHPMSLRDGGLCVTYRTDEDCEIRFGPLSLLLSPPEFQELVTAAQEAVRRLDEILASGVWERVETEGTLPGFLERLRRTHFSDN